MSSFCLVADYAQNLGLPHFGGEQPGDTYYFSPLAVYCFGVVDASRSPEVLHCFGYTEDQGSKGGNNVASLLLRALHQLEILEDGKCAKRLSFIMDNCSGQNKNGHVLRLALWLVEVGYFQTVEFIFYVRGYTKNLCDRMFNLLKKRYHQSQIYSVEGLKEKLNSLDNVHYYHVDCETFYDVNAMLSQCYKPFPTGSIKQNHFFWVECSNPTTMCSVLHNDDDCEVTRFNHILPMDPTEDRNTFLWRAFTNMTKLTAPGMKPIKQVELWKKWGPFVPEAERHHLCSRPSDDVIEKVASDRASKQRERENNNDTNNKGRGRARATNNNNEKIPATRNKRQRCNL